MTIASFNSYGQETATEGNNPDFKRVQIGVNVSPDICSRTIQNNGSTGGFIPAINDYETFKFGYTAGLNVCFNLKNFLGLETGIQYSNKGYQTKFEDLIFAQSFPTFPNKVKYIYNFHYIDIPVKVNFTFGKKKVRFFTSVGITTNVFIKETQTRISEYSEGTSKGKMPTGIDYNRFNLSPTISVGIDYKINERMNLRVEPTFRYGVLRIIDAPVTGYLYNAGLNISFYFGT